ncbi:hypothetical protein CVV72_29975 [Amycolatopsis sp. TNS106]|nr:hypothetical protein CVV72_29975 [Amycolatopsis sp. TNS106]
MTTGESPNSAAPREEARRLLTAVPDERVSAALAALRRLTEAPLGAEPRRRRFRTVGVFDGEHDLGRRAKELARDELGGGSSKSA